ncbi:hypothetical protein [Flavobacterium sp. 1355]|uniref:hypothetical protein n=1 Tax=Flavobacterium sp. 1355 TaxID=2806571 RepID=UPI001AE8AADC|nr:hypothetical protein [Flavobacterium sp. 1355]MBP1222341.1 hypothetical protein [Flavobacterium sp. 1355]
MKEHKLMIYLKIDNGKAYYRAIDQNWIELDQIGKDELLILLDKAITDDFEMDEFDVVKLTNTAHQIIYRHLYQKFGELKENKNRFKDESEQLYKLAFEKYSQVGPE